jgi:cytochrome c biogenesis protein CcdA
MTRFVRWSKYLLVISAVLATALPVVGQPPPLPAEAPGPSAGSMPGSAQRGAEGVVSLHAQFTAPTPDRSAHLFITATIKPGWHIYSITQAPGGPVASKIEVNPPPGVRIAGEFRASLPPETKKEPEAFGDLPIESHQGTITWYAPIELAAGIDPTKLAITGKVTVQPCDAKSCLAPQDLPFSAEVGPGVAMPGQPAIVPRPDLQTVLSKLAFAFLGGLILNLMPCVLPVISLKILSFLEQAREHRRRIFALNVWYSLGLLSVFMVLAALAATLGLAWGEQFTLPWFKVAMTSLVFVMALSFLGVWEIPIPGFVGARAAHRLQAKEGPSGAFFKGVFTTILATPCSGPFLGPVFGFLLKQPPYMAYWIFGAVGLGMASPYLVIGAFPRLIRVLPRPGAWMATVQQIMGFLLLATVVYLFTTLSAPYFVPTLALLVGLWFACWWIGRTPLTATEWQKNAAWIGGPAVAMLVGVFAFTMLFQAAKIPWQPFSPEALDRARAEGKTVMVDFSAEWCLTCKANLKFAVETNAVRDLVAANGVVPMLADWTDRSPTIKKALNELGFNSIPVLAIWPAENKGKSPVVLSDLLVESQVLAALQEAGPSKRR